MSETSSAVDVPLPSKKKEYVRAVGPRLRKLLNIVFALVALLGASSIYLASITFLDWISGRFGPGATYQNFFYICMFALHVLLGLALILPLVIFGFVHMWIAKDRRNRRAVRIGYALFTVSLLLLITGVLLVRIEGLLDLKHATARAVVYWLHFACPLVALWLYWLHRLAGPRIKWKLGFTYLGVVTGLVVVMVCLQMLDPRQFGKVGSPEGVKYYEPSLARTVDGKHIPERALMNNEYCLKCHADVYDDWHHSAHHFSSFTNPAYLTSISETREVSLKRDGNVKASRWCAGCHDPVPFFTGKFDDPNYDITNADDPTTGVGITCTSCHGMTAVNTNRGNADYTIGEPLHYPFAYSDNPMLQFINNQLVKAKPALHKKEMLKGFHRGEQADEFCSVCHKVHLPKELNHYKEFLRGQNHYDAFLLSGVSGHGARSFYYPPKAEVNCSGCHMPLAESDDFGAQDFDGTGKLKVHDHMFPSANTGNAYLQKMDETVEKHRDFLKGVMRVDLFGVKEGGRINDKLHGPLRPEVPELKPGGVYLLESVIRTMKMGHVFTQGTVDSNEVWLDVTVYDGGQVVDNSVIDGQVIGRSGGLDELGEVDPWSHFVNAFLLDRNGNRIDRRNAQDIFVPLYNHQIPPGAGQVVHHQLHMPDELSTHVIVDIKLKYRKFDKQYMDVIAAFHKKHNLKLRDLQKDKPYANKLPIVTLAMDRVFFPVAGSGVAGRGAIVDNAPREIEAWQRWNDYGIGLFLEAKSAATKGELRQAEYAFQQVEALGQYHGPMNLARVYNAEARLDEAVEVLKRASKYKDQPGFPTWTLSWLLGEINKQQGRLDEAIQNFREVVDVRTDEMIRHGFDFRQDYVVVNSLANTLFERAKQERTDKQRDAREHLLSMAINRYQQTLAIDQENVAAHYGLSQIYALLGDQKKAAHHKKKHEIYRVDDNARGFAVGEAQKKYPAARHAAQTLTIYRLHRPGAPELPESAWRDEEIEK